MTHAILLDEPGGPEVLQWRQIADPVAGEGELVVRNTHPGLLATVRLPLHGEAGAPEKM